MAKTLRKKNQTHEKMVESAGFLSNRGARKNAYRKWTAANTAYSGTGAFMVHLWSKLVHFVDVLEIDVYLAAPSTKGLRVSLKTLYSMRDTARRIIIIVIHIHDYITFRLLME